MKAYLSFMQWLSAGIADGAKLQGAGTLAVKEPDRAADLDHGKKVFAAGCAACHGADGLGKRAASGARLRVSAALGAGQLQQRRRHDAAAWTRRHS